MKALLLAAALGIPLAASADDPGRYGGDKPGATTTPAVPTEAFSEAKAVQTIHQIGVNHGELGNLAQARASNEDVRKFGGKMVKDYQKLSEAVSKYAKDNDITLSSAEIHSSGAMPTGSATTPGAAMGMPGERPTTPDVPAKGEVESGTEVYGEAPADKPAAKAEMKSEFQRKLSELKDLQGSEFDAKFLSTVIDGCSMALTQLKGWKGHGDKELDKLIERAAKVLGDHHKEAQRLEARIPAA